MYQIAREPGEPLGFPTGRPPVRCRGGTGRASAPLATALAYRDRGYVLVPIRPGTKEPHHALIREVRGSTKWSRLRDEPASESEIRKWFRLDPEAGVAAITGQPSGGLVVVDVDLEPQGGLELPETPTVVTRRGHHHHFHAQSAVANKQLPWGDLLADGKLAILPRSRHEDGGRYEWKPGASLHDLPLAPLPTSLCSERYSVSRLTGYPHEGLTAYPALGGGRTGSLRTRDLPGFVRSEGDLRLQAAELGINDYVRPRRKFLCVLHAETRASAEFSPDSSGVHFYVCWHSADGKSYQCYSLGEVRAALAYGEPRCLNRPEKAVWHLRLLAEAGIVSPVAVGDVPPHLTGVARRVFEGFLLLLGLRWLCEPGAPTAFTRAFARAWCGVGERQAGDALRDLVRSGLLRVVDAHVAGAKTLRLFLPGEAV